MDWIRGYVPDVLLGGSGEGSGGTGDPDDGEDEENILGGSVDMDTYDRDFGDVTTPEGARYPKALRCATGVAPQGFGWVAFWGLIAVVARRRR
jgi:hypothetical protein